jgi:pimeloyl-ACP methyl ester carboxylesterase
MDEPSGHVTSPDGTPIAYWRSGGGPPVVLVHGAMSDHRRWRILPWLGNVRTVYAIDRRGRGASGDAASWSLEHEVADVREVVRAIAAEHKAGVDLLGHSFGGLLALLAAADLAELRRLVLYEPAVNEEPEPPARLARLEQLLAAGDREGATELMMREVVKMPEQEIEFMRSQASWPSRVAAAHTLPRELGSDRSFDGARARRVAAPTLLILGGDSPAFVKAGVEAVARAVPNASVVVLEGQQHVADQTDPELFAGHVVEFLTAA